MIREGIFRGPRLKTNKLLKKYSYLFNGDIINVSGNKDSDKNCTLREYYFGDYDSGGDYKSYFTKANTYVVSNYKKGSKNQGVDGNEKLTIDLERRIPESLIGKFDVVFNHTTLEHIFDVQTAFSNLCKLSKDIVIIVVPQFQMLHDYCRDYKDYWRFTPFVVDKMFLNNDMTVLYRETTHGFSQSMYLFYIASKNPNKWLSHFSEIKKVREHVDCHNDGSSYTLFSSLILKLDNKIRQIIKKLR